MISWRALVGPLLLLIVANMVVETATGGIMFHPSSRQQWRTPSGHQDAFRLSRRSPLGIQGAAPAATPVGIAGLSAAFPQPHPPSSPPPAVFVPPRS